MKKVIVFGTFDILHQGHLDFFNQAKKRGDEVVAIVARNINVFKFKGHYPKNDEKVRLAHLVESGAVDVARLGNIDDPFKVIREEQPDTIALGYDQPNYEAGLQERFPDVEIVRLKAFKPEMYKSSKLIK